MKKLFITLLTLGALHINAQVKIGNNPTNISPSAALEIESTNKGLIITRVANTAAITSPVNGMIVYDLSSNCIKSYENGAWTDCLSSAPATASVVTNCDANGFVGTYVSGAALSGASYRVTITNNSFFTTVINFVSGDLVLSGVSGMTVGTPTGVPALSGGNATLNAGQSVVVTYPITGTPASCGVITGTWTKLSLSCIKTVFSVDGNFVLSANNVVRSGANITSFTANWSAVAGATNYTAEYSTSQSGPWTAFPANPYTGTSAVSGTLPGATNYWLRVTANGGLCSGNARIRSVDCGAPTSTGGFLRFMCHNLGANESADPFTPSWQLNGAYFQWGKKPVDTNGDGYRTKPNSGTEGFAAAPTGSTAGTANDAAVASWSPSTATNGAWNVTEGSPVKTANDPCPSGFRVPTRNEWVSIYSTTPINTQTNWSDVGTYAISTTNYSAGKNINNSLYLPAAGARASTNGSLNNRGNGGVYWSSTENSADAYTLFFNSGVVAPANFNSRREGFSVRCVAE